MSNGGRAILSLTPLVEAGTDRPIDLGLYDVLLPCRRFSINHKVAVLGSVSLTAEFMLRLVKSVEGISEEDAASFFGFSRRDMSFVLAEVESREYIDRQDGRLWLTRAGESLFRIGSDCPEIFEVERRRDTVGFDLVAIAPQEFTPLNNFERRLPELKLLDPALASSAAEHVRKSFRKHYTEIVTRKDSRAKRSLYSIDEVSPADRFSSRIRLVLSANASRPSAGEPNLSGWRSEFERDDRSDVIRAVSRFVDDLAVARGADDRDAFAMLAEIAPEFLQDFIRRDGLNVERYFREAFTRAGEVRSDRHTVPILGSLFTKEGSRRLFDIVDYGLRQRSARLPFAFWIVPQVPFWGATAALPEVLGQLRVRMLSNENANGISPTTIGMVHGKPAKYLEAAFDIVSTGGPVRTAAAFEMLLIPGVAVAAIVSAPIGMPRGTPVPLGFASFDDEVLRRAESRFADLLGPYSFSEDMLRAIDASLSGETQTEE